LSASLVAEVRLTAAERRLLREQIDAARRAKEQPAAGERRCFGCGEWKPLDEFVNAPKKPKGKSYQCKRCNKLYVREREKRIRAEGGERAEHLREVKAARQRRYRERKRALASATGSGLQAATPEKPGSGGPRRSRT
jgi:hypothetical protein